MKKILAVSALLVALSVTGCGKLMDALSNGNTPSGNAPKPADVSQVQLRTANGYVITSKANISSFQVRILMEGTTGNQFSPRTVSSSDTSEVINLIGPLAMHAPQVGNPFQGTNIAPTITGRITFEVLMPNGSLQPRALTIYNWYWAVDDSFSNSYYVSQKTRLDTNWEWDVQHDEDYTSVSAE